MSVNIDELQIEVSATSDKAEKSLDRLIKVMDRLQVSTEKCTGLTKVKNQLSKLHEIANQLNSLNSCNSKVENIVSSINKLNGINTPNLTKVRNQTAKLKEISKSINEMSDTSGKINSFVSSIKPLSELPKVNINSYIKSLEKLPELSKQLKSADLNEFTNGINRLTQAIKPLATEMQKLGNGYSVLPANIKNVVNSNQQLTTSNERVSRSSKTLGNCLSNIKVRTLAIVYGAKKLADVSGDCLNESNAYVENLNLFTVAMGNGAKAALDYAETVNDALGIDTSEWIRNQGIFKQITTGFGVIEDKSLLMSKNLTQLGYDISSFFNISIDESMQKLESGISGELEPLRRLGYALDAATLQQIAYDNGIKQNINTMTQAQKSQLRYLAIMQQSKNAMGDMSRTVITPANSLRILEQQFTQLKRAIGNVVSVVAVKLIPYIHAAVKLLTEFAGDLAKKWGFELPKIDYSDTTKATKDVAKGMEDVSDNADDAKESVKKTVKEMQRLAGFDELNILQRDKETDNENSTKKSTKKKNNTADLGLDLPEYDFLKGTNKESEEIYKKMKDKLKDLKQKFQDLATWIEKNKGLVKGLAGLLAGLWALNKVKKFMNALGGLSIFQPAKKWLKDFIDGFKKGEGISFFKRLSNGVKEFRKHLTRAQRILGTIVGTTMASIGSYNLFNNLAKGTLDWKKALGDTALIIGGIGTAALFGGPVGAAVAVLGAAFFGLYGYIEGVHEAIIESETAFVNSQIFNNGGITVGELTDAFKNQFGSLSDLNTKLQEYDQQIDTNRSSIDDYRSTVETYAQKIEGTGKLSEDEIKPMKDAVDGLVEALQKGNELECTKFFDIVKTSVATAAETVGIDIGTMTEQLQIFQTTFASETDKLNADVQNYLDKLELGEPISAEEKKKYEDALTKLTNLSGKVSKEEVNFKQKLADLSKVDFQSPEEFEKAFEDLKKSAEDVKKANEDVHLSALTNYENLKLQVQSAYDNGIIKEDMYDATVKQLENYKIGIDKAYEDKKGEIQDSLKNITQGMYDTLETSIQSALEDRAATEKKPLKIVVEQDYADLKDSFKWAYDDLNKFIEDEGIKINTDSYEKWKRNVRNVFTAKDLLDSQELKEEAMRYGHMLPEGASEGLTNSQKDYLKSIDENEAHAIDEWKRMWNIHSPSKVTKEIGKNLVLGEANGISEHSNIVIKSIKDLFNQSFKELNKFSFLAIGENIVKSISQGINNCSDLIKNSLKNILQNDIQISTNANIQVTGKAISGFATGGYPEKAQLFYAREDGKPEMVGKIGNQTAVANNEQITEGIANAVYKGYCAAMNSRIATGGETKVTHISKVYLAEREIGQAVDEYQNRQSVRSGGRR